MNKNKKKIYKWKQKDFINQKKVYFIVVKVLKHNKSRGKIIIEQNQDQS